MFVDAQASSGLVVHMCDIGGDRPMPGYAHCSVSKSALIGLVKAMTVELGPEVRTVGISPGHVVWPEDWSEAFRREMLNRIRNRVVPQMVLENWCGFYFVKDAISTGMSSRSMVVTAQY